MRKRMGVVLALALTLTGVVTSSAAGLAAPTSVPAQQAASAGGYVSVTPARVLDTRSSSALTAQSTRSVTLKGVAGVPTDAEAVSVTITATASTANTWISAWSGEEPTPAVSQLSVAPGRTVSNTLILATGTDTSAKLYNRSGSVHLLVDVVGYYTSTAAGGQFRAVTPSRIVDTRTGAGAPQAPIGAGGTATIAVAGRGGVPATGVAAVAVNVTAINATSTSYLTVWGGGTRPVTSNVSVDPSGPAGSLVICALDPDGAAHLQPLRPGRRRGRHRGLLQYRVPGIGVRADHPDAHTLHHNGPEHRCGAALG